MVLANAPLPRVEPSSSREGTRALTSSRFSPSGVPRHTSTPWVGGCGAWVCVRPRRAGTVGGGGVCVGGEGGVSTCTSKPPAFPQQNGGWGMSATPARAATPPLPRGKVNPPTPHTPQRPTLAPPWSTPGTRPLACRPPPWPRGRPGRPRQRARPAGGRCRARPRRRRHARPPTPASCAQSASPATRGGRGASRSGAPEEARRRKRRQAGAGGLVELGWAGLGCWTSAHGVESPNLACLACAQHACLCTPAHLHQPSPQPPRQRPSSIRFPPSLPPTPRTGLAPARLPRGRPYQVPARLPVRPHPPSPPTAHLPHGSAPALPGCPRRQCRWWRPS